MLEVFVCVWVAGQMALYVFQGRNAVGIGAQTYKGLRAECSKAKSGKILFFFHPLRLRVLAHAVALPIQGRQRCLACGAFLPRQMSHHPPVVHGAVVL